MAQTAKIISPEKKVLLPNINAGCLMADMINHQQMVEFKKKIRMHRLYAILTRQPKLSQSATFAAQVLMH